MKQAVIFDMDGVLIDSEHFYFERRMNFFDELGIEPGTRKIKDFIGLTNEMIWKILIPDDNKQRKIFKEKYIKYCQKHDVFFPQLLNHSTKKVFTILKNKNIKIAIASSSEKKYIKKMLAECKLEDYVDFIISGEECEKSKPDPEIYLKAVNGLNLLPEQALAIEDSKLGIHSAKLAGLLVGALIQKDYYADQSEADFKINDLIEIVGKF